MTMMKILLLSAAACAAKVAAESSPLYPKHLAFMGLGTVATKEPSGSADQAKTKKKSSMKTSTSAGAPIPSATVPLGTVDMEQHEPLLKDIELLSGILAEVVERENPRVHDLYCQLRQYGLDRAADLNNNTTNTNNASNNLSTLQKMIDLAQNLTAQECLGVMRTFSMALNLVNAAEVHHRLRLVVMATTSNDDEKDDLSSSLGGASLHSSSEGPFPLIEDSIRGTLEALLEEGHTKEEIFQQLLEQRVEIVLTAHPTEVNRRTHLRKFRKVSEILPRLERVTTATTASCSSYERHEHLTELRRIISSLWGCDEIRRSKPTPQQEALGGVAIIESVLWEAVPAYWRKLDAQCRETLGMRLPVKMVPMIRFASWIGGDRDGNPNVTPTVTKQVEIMQRLRAAKLLLKDLHALYSELAISSRYTPELEELAAKVSKSTDKIEKYRRVIGHLRQRLSKTVQVCETELSRLSPEGLPVAPDSQSWGFVQNEWQSEEPIWEKDDLMSSLQIMYDSLVATGYGLVADGLLLDIIRRVATFGLTLVPLDIREESTKHTLAIDAITRYLGIGSYKQWDEETRLSFLQNELASKRPLIHSRDLDKMGFDETVVKTLSTFNMASSLRPESLGAYVISQAQTASDVLGVMLLQKQFGMTPANGNMMRVVPLFETLDDLENAPEKLEILFSIPSYVGAIKSSQEVMVGYSDSAKDAGRLAACWAQYNSQERMAEVARKHGIELTFFHGKGGTVGRGGNPALYRAILSHPPNTINGRFRVTEQGEMITKNFGAPTIAERTLDIYTAAVLREAFTKHVKPNMKWRRQMERISKVSCADYRFLVREEPRFVPYFRQATPELELGTLNIGSRPAKRNPKGGIESLRAIPWTFAWTQTRTHLSAWLGVGAGLQAETADDLATLREMYKGWPWFRETIDLIAMILSKTDFSISANYDAQLVDKTPELIGLGEEVRDKLVQTRQAVLDVTESKDVGGAHVALLRASSTIRHPYVDPINIVQAEVLKRLRALEKADQLSDREVQEKETLHSALVVSVTGVAEGMRNSG